MPKKELSYDGITVVFDNPLRYFDTKRLLLINVIKLYALLCDREVRVIFFNGDDEETGASFFFKKK